MMFFYGLLVGLAVAGVGIVITFLMGRANLHKIEAEKTTSQGKVDQIRKELESARREAEVRIKDEVFKRKEALEGDVEGQRQVLKTQEGRLEKREDNLDRKLSMIDKKERFLTEQEERTAKRSDQVADKLKEAEESLEEQQRKLLKISGMSMDEAKEAVLERVTRNLDDEVYALTERRLQRAKDEVEVKANKMVVDAMQRCAADAASENLVSTVELPSDDMKGRIIGREGRNIRAFEKATGVDVIVDDTPGVVVVSGFDSVRRATARMALSKLVTDGRIHPARIEEVVKQTEKEMLNLMEEAGRQTSMDLGVGNLSPKLIAVLGRLKYRTSYGQNVLQHSAEVSTLCGLLAAELKLDVDLARRVGLLHDIGKAIDQEVEGTHPTIGASLAAKANEKPVVVNAIAAHHEDVPPESLYAVLVQVGDAISAARPGARRESMERYIKRLERLEDIANNYDGVEKAFAIQAGRELRVIAKATMLGEGECTRICCDIAKEIEEELSYPGEVKVTMIRENRFVEYAR
jgi:ribonucrease Y